jgi:hypothetical protein
MGGLPHGSASTVHAFLHNPRAVAVAPRPQALNADAGLTSNGYEQREHRTSTKIFWYTCSPRLLTPDLQVLKRVLRS